jgi:hypothetical protein
LGAFVDDYEFDSAPAMYRNAIRYKILPKLDASEELSYTAWFNLRDFYDNQQMLKRPNPIININLISSSSDTLVFNSFPRKHKLDPWLSYDTNPEGYVSIKGDSQHSGGYRVLDVVDEYTFTVENLFIPKEIRVCDALTGKNERVIYTNKDQSKDLIFIKGANRTLYLKVDNVINSDSYIINGISFEQIDKHSLIQVPLGKIENKNFKNHLRKYIFLYF